MEDADNQLKVSVLSLHFDLLVFILSRYLNSRCRQETNNKQESFFL